MEEGTTEEMEVSGNSNDQIMGTSKQEQESPEFAAPEFIPQREALGKRPRAAVLTESQKEKRREQQKTAALYQAHYSDTLTTQEISDEIWGTDQLPSSKRQKTVQTKREGPYQPLAKPRKCDALSLSVPSRI